jgi:hypothetical protein
MKELKLILKEQVVGREATPWLEPHRERFAKAAHEAAIELQGTKLKGAARIQAFNRRIAEKLRPQSQGLESP